MLPAMRSVNGSLFPSLLLDDGRFEQLMRTMNGGSSARHDQTFFPLDFIEKSDSYIIQVEVAGVERENIDLSLDDKTLSIKIERQSSANEEGESYLLRGRWYGTTTRLVSLPDAVASEGVEASLKNGVLTIVLQKQAEKQARKIEVKAMD